MAEVRVQGSGGGAAAENHIDDAAFVPPFLVQGFGNGALAWKVHVDDDTPGIQRVQGWSHGQQYKLFVDVPAPG